MSEPSLPANVIESLSGDVIQGLQEFYPILSNAEVRAAAIERAMQAVALTDDRQADYEKLRDGVEQFVKDLVANGAGPWCEFAAFQRRHSAAIENLLQASDAATVRDAHWDLVDELKGALGSRAANDSSDDACDQERRISEAESWVADNVSQAGDAATVAIAAWLYGFEGARLQLRAAAADPASGTAAVTGATRLVEVRLGALVRREYVEVVEVPADITEDELAQLVDRRYREDRKSTRLNS